MEKLPYSLSLSHLLPAPTRFSIWTWTMRFPSQMLWGAINMVINKAQPSKKIFLAFQSDSWSTLRGWIFSTPHFAHLTKLYVIHKPNVSRLKSQSPWRSNSSCTSGRERWEACGAAGCRAWEPPPCLLPARRGWSAGMGTQLNVTETLQCD